MKITNSLLADLKHLPDIGDTAAMVAKIKAAEEALVEAEERVKRELEDLAERLADKEDGWSYMEIWQTPLRGNRTIIERVRKITGEA